MSRGNDSCPKGFTGGIAAQNREMLKIFGISKIRNGEFLRVSVVFSEMMFERVIVQSPIDTLAFE